MCSDCGSRDPGRRFQVDGSTHVLCGRCIGDLVAIAGAHEHLRRIHFAAHGHDIPCPVCDEDRQLLDARAREAQDELDAIMARVPYPMAFDAEGTLIERLP